MRLAIDGVVGEEDRAGLFGDVEFVTEFSEENKGRASDFSYLLKCLRRFFNGDL